MARGGWGGARAGHSRSMHAAIRPEQAPEPFPPHLAARVGRLVLGAILAALAVLLAG